jgi:hypothetical protein
MNSGVSSCSARNIRLYRFDPDGRTVGLLNVTLHVRNYLFVCDLAQLDRCLPASMSTVQQSRFSRDSKGYSLGLARA